MPLNIDGMPSPTSDGISPERRRVSVASASARKVQKSRSASRAGSITSLASLASLSLKGEGSGGNGKAVVKRGARMRKGTGGSASGVGRR
jgi:hypothetical protein